MTSGVILVLTAKLTRATSAIVMSVVVVAEIRSLNVLMVLSFKSLPGRSMVVSRSASGFHVILGSQCRESTETGMW